MPHLRETARRRRAAAAAHEGSRPDRRAALRRPLSTLWRVCSLRRCEANAMASSALACLAPEPSPNGRRAPTVHQRVRVLLAARD